MKTVKEIEAALSRLSLSDLEYVRDLIEDRIQDHLEITPEVEERLSRAHRETEDQFERH
jgi:hypothetical protein